METERRPRLVVELLPEDLPLVRRLKSRAALEGITVRELVLGVLREADRVATNTELDRVWEATGPAAAAETRPEA
jgi:hypothetical protein